jgi:sugar lactone lactonase YvrE
MNLKSIARWAIAAFLMAVASLSPTYAGDWDDHDPNCRPADGAHFLCGVVNVEALVRVDGTHWAVGSSAAGGPLMLAPLYFIDLDKKAAHPLDPTTVRLTEDYVAYPGCPGPADFSNLQTLAVTYAKVKGRHTLFVVSHGGRFTIQVFEMKFAGRRVPTLSWLGCVMPPNAHFWPDVVAALPDGGMLVTSLFDPLDPNFVNALKSGQPYGLLGEWHPGTGWTEAYPNTFAGPNGVILSKDANMVFVANWSGKSITRVDRRTGEKATVHLPMLVDNLTWNEDGSKILAGGQTACAGSAAAVNCDVKFSIYEINPVTLTEKLIVGPTLLGVMGGGTGALQYRNALWITSYRSDRIARIKYPHSAPRHHEHGER